MSSLTESDDSENSDRPHIANIIIFSNIESATVLYSSLAISALSP